MEVDKAEFPKIILKHGTWNQEAGRAEIKIRRMSSGTHKTMRWCRTLLNNIQEETLSKRSMMI
jgi:hypothetical protein